LEITTGEGIYLFKKKKPKLLNVNVCFFATKVVMKCFENSQE
jgi:hypothetical protein